MKLLWTSLGSWLLLLVILAPALTLRAATPEAATRPPTQALTPNLSPYPHPGRQRVRQAQWAVDHPVALSRILTTLTLAPGQLLPAFDWLSQADARRHDLHFTAQQWFYPGPYRTQALVATSAQPPGAAFVDSWTPILHENFAQPPTGCVTYASQSGWVNQGWQGISNGAGQVYALKPLVAPNRSSWLVCGPFAHSKASRVLTQFTYRLGIDTHTGDQFFFGVSSDGQAFQGVSVAGFTADWLTQQVYLEGIPGERFWLAWAFTGDSTVASDAALWLDDLQVWHYTPLTEVCGGQKQGNKGVVLPAYDPTANPHAPMVRVGDVSAAVNLQRAGVRWVRLGFQLDGSTLDLRAYDRMVDTLCAHGISVLGLLNQEMLPRTDYASPDETQFAHYQQEFAAMTHFLAGYFAHRIDAWEIWNEPNLGEGAYLSPPRYASLLQQSHQAIKRANPHAQVIFGGLASAWADSHAYLAAVYAAWDQQLGGVRPFDHLAIHPYPRKREGPDPALFLAAEGGQATILDKFLQLMAQQGDGDKTIWVTELGFNSAKSSRNRPPCLNGVLVNETEQAAYAATSLDILFNQVKLWEQPAVPAVEKIFWYQYMDVGTIDPCWLGAGRNQRPHKDWWFGLYRGDKVTPKPVWCTFAAYPLACETLRGGKLYLPVVIGDGQ